MFQFLNSLMQADSFISVKISHFAVEKSNLWQDSVGGRGGGGVTCNWQYTVLQYLEWFRIGSVEILIGDLGSNPGRCISVQGCFIEGLRRPWSSLPLVVTPTWFKNAELQVPDYSEMNDLQVLFGLNPSEVHVQINTCKKVPNRQQYSNMLCRCVQTINKLFE
jgi:hypothetical protein